ASRVRYRPVRHSMFEIELEQGQRFAPATGAHSEGRAVVHLANDTRGAKIIPGISAFGDRQNGARATLSQAEIDGRWMACRRPLKSETLLWLESDHGTADLEACMDWSP